jgi:hypothetical protein
MHSVLHDRVLAVKVGADASQFLNFKDANLTAAVNTHSTGSSSSTSIVRAAAPGAYAYPLRTNADMVVVALL